MTSRFDRNIKAIAATIGEPRDFRRTGASLGDCLRNCIKSDDTADLVGARLLDYFCFDDDREFNNFFIGVKLTLAFLDDVLGAPEGNARQVGLQDLKSILHNRPAFEQIHAWVRAHYQ